MYLVPVTNSHPKLQAWKYPLVGDKDVTMIERVVIDVPTHTVVRLKMPPDQHRSTLCDNVACRGTTWDDVEWSPDDAHLAFVSTSRDHKQEWFRVADAATGEVREVMTEKTPKFYESGNGKINWHYLPASNEILWFSERDDWGNLYLYDLASGKLKNQITQGPATWPRFSTWTKRSAQSSLLAWQGSGPRSVLRAFLQRALRWHRPEASDPENADHNIKVSSDGRYFVDSYSTPTDPHITVIRGQQW